MSEIDIAFAEDILSRAERLYLLAHGWTEEKDAYKTQSGRFESTWSLSRDKHQYRKRYVSITQGHAMNAQKKMTRDKEYRAGLRRSGLLKDDEDGEQGPPTTS